MATTYASTDGSAPVLSGTNGSLVALLDAILVNGYGAKAAAGWTKQFSGTNKAVYKAGSGLQFVFRVLDDGSLAAVAREAVVRGAESASTVDALTDPFPLVAQKSDANCVWRKSGTADSTARAWLAIATDQYLLLFIDFTGTVRDIYAVGQVPSFLPTDNYNFLISVRGAGNLSTGPEAMTSDNYGCVRSLADAIAVSPGSIFFARTADGVVKSPTAAVLRAAGAATFGQVASNPAYPHPITNKLHLCKVAIRDAYSTTGTPSTGLCIRTQIPFLFEPLHTNNYSSMSNGDTFADTAYDAGSTFVIYALNVAALNSAGAKAVIQTAGNWSIDG